ncbi:MAG TPA: L-threonylcarbamoyladenylate synthase [Rhizomicrobium sp.]|jgi:L-threonylcarbamoyladenylate synthase|nr:L-threonylcarbamoyladenylate synthase [Rhizomicrobium sp.]
MTTTQTSRVRPVDDAAIAQAARVLRDGGLVAFPTETVYGLGADARNDRAVASIFAAKGRPSFNPLIVHVSDLRAAQELAVFGDGARKMADAFWPGPLTLILPRKAGAKASALVSAGLDTIAIRSPSHPAARALLAAAGMPVAAPSANPSGRLSATTARDVADELGDSVDLVLDGGATPLGLESTIVGFEGAHATLLRPGAIARDAIEAITGPLAQAPALVQAPGQLESHYAPRARLRLNAHTPESGEVFLGFGVAQADGVSLNLSARGDLHEAAANLFAMLRALDKTGAKQIAVAPIPETGIGEAINDRLRRAAAPRGAP